MNIKQIICIFSLFAFLCVSCEDDNKSPVVKQNPALTFDISEIPAVDFNDEITLTGTATSPNAIRDISFYLVKKVNDGYERLWFSPLQYADIMIDKTVDFEAKIVIDDPEANAVAVVASDPYEQSTVSYIPIQQINGSPSGSAYVFNELELAAEYEYGGSCPYVFSLTGVNVDGSLKHVVSLEEIKKTNARNLDFAFTNIWRNSTKYTAGVLGNWGYAFCEFRQLARGPVGRQCDYLYLTNSTAIPKGTDTCCVVLVSNAIANANNFEEVFKNAGDNYGTSNFLNSLEGLFTAKAIGSQYIVNMKTNASGVNTTACKENAGAGSYIAFRKTKNKTQHTYGLIRIAEMPDVTDAVDNTGLKYKPEPYVDDVTDNAHLPQKWYDGASVDAVGIAKLYGRKVKVDIIAQK